MFCVHGALRVDVKIGILISLYDQRSPPVKGKPLKKYTFSIPKFTIEARRQGPLHRGPQRKVYAETFLIDMSVEGRGLALVVAPRLWSLQGRLRFSAESSRLRQYWRP